MLEAAQPSYFGPQGDDLTHDEENADRKHTHDHAVQDRRVQEHPKQVVAQHVGQARNGAQEQQHTDEIGEGIAHAFSYDPGAADGRSRARHQDIGAFTAVPPGRLTPEKEADGRRARFPCGGCRGGAEAQSGVGQTAHGDRRHRHNQLPFKGFGESKLSAAGTGAGGRRIANARSSLNL
jgi:hypothetical protein